MFLAYSLGVSLFMAGMGQIPVFIVGIFIDKAFSESNASLGLLLYNVFNGRGRIILSLALRIPNIVQVDILTLASVIGIIGM